MKKKELSGDVFKYIPQWCLHDDIINMRACFSLHKVLIVA